MIVDKSHFRSLKFCNVNVFRSNNEFHNKHFQNAEVHRTLHSVFHINQMYNVLYNNYLNVQVLRIQKYCNDDVHWNHNVHRNSCISHEHLWYHMWYKYFEENIFFSFLIYFLFHYVFHNNYPQLQVQSSKIDPSEYCYLYVISLKPEKLKELSLKYQAYDLRHELSEKSKQLPKVPKLYSVGNDTSTFYKANNHINVIIQTIDRFNLWDKINLETVDVIIHKFMQRYSKYCITEKELKIVDLTL